MQTWPIYEPSGRVPEGWPGWPEGRQFAFVLSHNVDGQAGLRRCRQLAELEMKHGFRSAFYFSANSDYEVPLTLLEWLRKNGFEVAVSDTTRKWGATLSGAGKAFDRRAQAINRKLKEMGGVGFRSDCVGNRLDHLHALNIEYDASTIDFDPFTAQLGCVQTIFPFWVARPDPDADALRPLAKEMRGVEPSPLHSSETNNLDGRGFMELPNTLAPPYQLFVVRQDRNINCWKTKLRWLADKGAMASLESRPDHMAMEGQIPGGQEYPIHHYRDFLEHAKSEYAGRCWAALPRAVAAHCRTFRPKQARPPLRVAMLSYSYYKSDNRVRRYAESLAGRGDHVTVFCIGTAEQLRQQRCETVNGVEMVRLVARPVRGSAAWLQAWRLGCFFWKTLTHLRSTARTRGCDLLHVHNVPDFLVFAGALLKWGGTKVILDIHDIMPELYESKFKAGRWSLPVAVLRWMEKWSCGFADHVIIANHIWKKKIVGRSAPAGKVSALVNNVDLEIFSPQARTRADQRIILIYPGTLNRHQGLDLAIDAVKSLVPDIPDIELHIYGGGSALPELKKQAETLKLTNHIRFFPGVFLDEVPKLIANADIGIVPKRAEGFGDQAYSTKIMEFMSQGLPVVLSRTRIDSLYFDDSVVAFFESGNQADLADKIRRVVRDLEYRRSLAANGYAYAREHSWEQVKHVYLNLVDRLTAISLQQPS